MGHEWSIIGLFYSIKRIFSKRIIGEHLEQNRRFLNFWTGFIFLKQFIFLDRESTIKLQRYNMACQWFSQDIADCSGLLKILCFSILECPCVVFFYPGINYFWENSWSNLGLHQYYCKTFHVINYCIIICSSHREEESLHQLSHVTRNTISLPPPLL